MEYNHKKMYIKQHPIVEQTQQIFKGTHNFISKDKN